MRSALPAIFLFLLFFSSGLSGQKRYLFTIYNTSDGLANNNILAINQDRDGYMYFGTDVGLTRFDGTDFDNNVINTVTENSAFVEYIGSTETGYIVVASAMQGFFIQQSDGTFRQHLLTKPQIGKNVVKSLKVVSEGKIYLTTGIELYLFENDVLKRVLYDNSNQSTINSVELDSKGNVWFGGYRGVAVMPAGDTTLTPYYLPELQDKYVYKVFIGSHGNMFVGTIKGLYRITFSTCGDYTQGYKVDMPFPELANTAINHIYSDRHGDLWVATPSSGVYVISNGVIKDNITSENGLPSVGVLRTFQDREGNYWFATNSGIVKLTDFNRYAFSYQGEMFSTASNITSDGFGRYFLNNSSDIYVICRDTVHKLITPDIITRSGGIKRCLISNDTLWISNYDALFCLALDERMPDFKKVKVKARFTMGEISRIRCMNRDDIGNIWIASDKGILLFRGNRLFRCQINDEKASRIRPVKIIRDNYGYYWFGDFSYGLYRMKLGKHEGNTVHLDSVLSYKSLKPDSLFITAWVQDMTLDHNGNLWLSSLYTGAYRLKIGPKGVEDHKLFCSKNGLSANQITDITEDDQQRIWFATIEGADCYDPVKDTLIHFSNRNAPGKQVLSILPDNSRTILEYNEGIVVVSDIRKEFEPSAPMLKTIITAISVNGIRDTVPVTDNRNTQYPYSKNNITFEYGTISFRNENTIRYQHWLEGLDNDWGTATENRNISFTNLAPGRYRFMVRAVTDDAGRCGDVASFSFRVEAPFYMTWWFLTLTGAFLLSGLYMFYRYRLKQALKVERLRSRIASDLHDDIGSTLSSISILSEILSTQHDHNPASAEMITKIGTNARNMLDSMDDIIWSVNPSNDRFRNLNLRIREYAIPLFEAMDIDFSITTDEQLDLVQLHMDVRRNVYLIAKESVNNLVKYSCCGMASITFQHQGSSMVMTITDNGRGFDSSEPSSRNGLRNMSARANQISARLDIITSPGNGTTVRMTKKII